MRSRTSRRSSSNLPPRTGAGAIAFMHRLCEFPGAWDCHLCDPRCWTLCLIQSGSAEVLWSPSQRGSSPYHVQQLLQQCPRGLPLALQHFIEMGIANPFLEHLLKRHAPVKISQNRHATSHSALRFCHGTALHKLNAQSDENWSMKKLTCFFLKFLALLISG